VEGILSREISKEDSYKERVHKLIPAEVVAVYFLIITVLEKATFLINGIDYTTTVQFSFFLIILIFLPVYLVQYQKVMKAFQLVITTINFLFWASAFDREMSLYGVLLLVLWTFISPLLIKTNSVW
jgi:hypothetical protein